MRAISHTFVPVLTVVLSAALQGQQVQHPLPAATDVSYGPHQRNVLDLWLAKAERPTALVIFLHPGGFMQGSKNNVPAALLSELLAKGISFASVEYRLTNDAPFPAQMQDGARAVQFLRSRATDWNLDPNRFGAIGGSAGGGIALWVGFHDDLADPRSSDPVLRQSSRLQVIVGNNAQSSYDPRWMDSTFRTRVEEHPFFKPFYRLDTTEFRSPRAVRLYTDASPVSLLTKDDPPVYLYYSQQPRSIIDQPDADFALHHIEQGLRLKVRMEALKIECIVKHADDYGLPVGRGGPFGGPDAVGFLAAHLSLESGSRRP